MSTYFALSCKESCQLRRGECGYLSIFQYHRLDWRSRKKGSGLEREQVLPICCCALHAQDSYRKREKDESLCIFLGTRAHKMSDLEEASQQTLSIIPGTIFTW